MLQAILQMVLNARDKKHYIQNSQCRLAHAWHHALLCSDTETYSAFALKKILKFLWDVYGTYYLRQIIAGYSSSESKLIRWDQYFKYVQISDLIF